MGLRPVAVDGRHAAEQRLRLLGGGDGLELDDSTVYRLAVSADELTEEMRALFDCKGGGKPDAVQGKVTAEKAELAEEVAPLVLGGRFLMLH